MKIADQRLVPTRYRWPALGAALAAVAVLVALGVHYAGATTAGRFDRAVDGWFARTAGGRMSLWFADIGNPPVVALAVVAVAGGCAAARYWRGLALVLVALPLATALGEWGIKPAVDRTKWGALAYPSGHATGAFALALVIVLLASGAGRQVLSRAAAAAVAAAALLVAVLCGLGLIASDYHYATDVVGGLCLALAGVAVCALLIDLLPPRPVTTKAA